MKKVLKNKFLDPILNEVSDLIAPMETASERFGDTVARMIYVADKGVSLDSVCKIINDNQKKYKVKDPIEFTPQDVAFFIKSFHVLSGRKVFTRKQSRELVRSVQQDSSTNGGELIKA